MDYIGLIFAIVIAMVIVNFISIGLQKYFGPKPVPPNMPKPILANLLAELDLLIDMEIIGVIEIPLMIKEIPLITNFKEVQEEVIKNVVDSLSTNLYIEANKCGVKRAYILTYITRRSHAKILEFMKEHNLTLK